MRRADAPPPGWYPDPTGRSWLTWWDGLDWTEHRRPPPAFDFDAGSAAGEPAAAAGGTTSAGGEVASATQLRARAEVTRSEARREARRAEGDAAALVAEARRAARDEVDRAVAELRGQVTSTTEQWRPRLEEYRRRLRRWSRVAIVVVVVVVALSAWLNATASVGLLEWLGERIDSATSLVVPIAAFARTRSADGLGLDLLGDRSTHDRHERVSGGAHLR